jgi:hypothetical protein
MGRYYFDLRDQHFVTRDTHGEEWPDAQAAGERASLILSQVAGEVLLTEGNKSIRATVRDEANHIVFSAILSIVGEWTDQAAEAA